MKLFFILILTFSILSCSSTSETQKVRYKTSAAAPTLEIPPDLTRLDDSNNRGLPRSTIGTRQATGRFKDSGPILERVLPKIQNVSLHGVGDYHWLAVKESPDVVYDLLKGFWAEEGFTLDQDEPLIGIMKTEWLENKGGTLTEEDSFFSSLFSIFRTTDTKEQYKTRIQRDEKNRKSLVYLTQYGQEYILLDDEVNDRSSGWQSRPQDPELEIEMLSRMMIYFGLQDEQVKQELAKLGVFSKRARLIKNEDEQTVLLMKESIDRGWNRLLAQLDRFNIEVVDKDKENGTLHLKKKGKAEKKEKGFFASLFSSNDDKKEEGFIEFFLSIETTSNDTTVIKMVNSAGNGDDSTQANEFLQFLFERLR